MPSAARLLNTYVDRRLRIPVDRGSLVLDVGGGDQPHWRADVIVDLYPDDEHASQRCFGGRIRVDRPVFAVDAGRLPFRSQSFDYVVCSHTLEHVPDPAAAISEMCRVAKRGYIEVPEIGMAKIDDFPTHLWWCTRDGDRLVFRAKEARAFDPDIARVLSDDSFRRSVLRAASLHFDRCIIALHWSGEVEVSVEGEPDLALAEVDEWQGSRANVVTGAARSVVRAGAKALWEGRRRRNPLTLGSILDDDRFGELSAPLRPQIYRPTD